MSVLFLGGYLYPYEGVIRQLNIPILEGVLSGAALGIKACILVFMFIWVRASMPRIRYDQLMTFCWTVLLPLVFAFMFLILLVLVSFDAIPFNHLCLFSPGLTAYNSKKGDSEKPLYSFPMAVEKIYDNFHEQTTQDSIQKDLRGLSGVYAFRHNPSNKMYIGSSVDLIKRFLEHFKGTSSNIHLQRAFKKYGYESFSFIIIEFVPRDIILSSVDEKKFILVSLEQKYLDLISDKYNINPTAGSSLGVKRSEETKKLLSEINGLKFLGKTHTEEYKEILRQRILGKNNPMYGKPVTEENKKLFSVLFSKPIYVYDANTLILIAKFNKQKDFITEFKVSTKTIVKYKDSGEVFRDKYIISSYPIAEKD